MTRGLDGLFYTSQPEDMRAFLREKLQLPHTDVGEGWLIFDLREADIGCHPVDESGQPLSGTQELSFYSDKIEETVAGLKQRGVVFDQTLQTTAMALSPTSQCPAGSRSNSTNQNTPSKKGSK